MSGVCVEKRGSVQIFLQEDGKYDGYDFATNKYIPNPYEDEPPDYKPVAIKKSAAQIAKEMAEIGEYISRDLPERKLKKKYLEHYGIKVGVSEVDGVTPTIHYYPYTKQGNVVGYKARLIENKRMWSVGEQKDVDLFGWEQALASASRKLLITEGELDAVALYQIIKDKDAGGQYADRSPSVVSLPHGAGAAPRDLTRVLKQIREHFKEIVLVFDNDEAGRKAIAEVMLVIPDATVATLPAKDANECLIKGIGGAAYAAVIFNSAKPKNTRIVSGNDLHEKGKIAPQFGFSWPWKHLTDVTRGIRLGETYYFGAAPKMGKSEIVNAITAHFIKVHEWKVFVCKPEEANAKTYKLVAGKLTGKFFHDPTREFDEKAYDAAGEIMRDKLFMLDLYQHVGWEGLKTDIRAAANDGCKAIIIDPITNLTNGMSAADANVKLQEIAQELSALALDLNVAIFIFCHLRNPDGGPSHDRGGEVLSSQFAGSRAMARSCNYMLGLEGNRDPSLTPEERNMRQLVLLEDREFGEVGRYGLYWDHHSGLFQEINV